MYTEQEELRARIDRKYIEVSRLRKQLEILEQEIQQDEKRLHDQCDHEWLRDFQTVYGSCDRAHYYCCKCLATQ